MSQTNPLAYAGEYGWTFRINTDFNATGVNAVAIEFKAPDGTKTSETATAITTDADGDFGWPSTDGYFTEGMWTAQLVLTYTGVKVLKSELLRFSIGPAINAA